MLFAYPRIAQITTRIYGIRKVTATIDARSSPMIESPNICPIFAEIDHRVPLLYSWSQLTGTSDLENTAFFSSSAHFPKSFLIYLTAIWQTNGIVSFSLRTWPKKEITEKSRGDECWPSDSFYLVPRITYLYNPWRERKEALQENWQSNSLPTNHQRSNSKWLFIW